MVDFMKRALELASEALSAQEVPVGCVFVINSEIIAESRNIVNATHNPTRHAEINCIDSVIEHCKTNDIDYMSYFKNVTVYVTVEPCIMCAAALNNLMVKEVVYGCANDRFGGKTVLDISNFYEYNYNLVGNLMANEAMALLKQFYKGANPNAPESKVKKDKTLTIN